MVMRETQALIKMARHGQVNAQLALGRLYLEGEYGLAPNQEAAMSWLTRAWKAGSLDAALDIAEHVDPPLRFDVTTADYIAACKDASAAGSAAADFGLGTIYTSVGDNLSAIASFRRAAEGGHAAAARRLGELLVAEAVDASSFQTARAWLEEAAQRGDANAARPLADLLWRQQDPAAESWLRQLSMKGDTESMVRLAEMLLHAPQTSAQVLQ